MSNNERPVTAAAPLSRIVALFFICLLGGLYFYNMAMNMHHTGGLPYWDDWQYFFGDSQGLHVPLTWENLFAKEADYVAPLLRAAGRGAWLAVGADFLALRLLMWGLFGVMLAVYAGLLWRINADPGWSDGQTNRQGPVWAAAAAGMCLLSGLSVEYFYYQHMAFGQPLFFILFFACLWALAARAWLLGVVFMALSASMSIFGASYAIGAAGYALALAAAAWPRRGLGAFSDPRVWAAAPAGLAVAGGIGWLTFAGSYANHTGQGLAMPWTLDFWAFTLSAFAAALGVPPDWPTRVVLPVGLLGLLLFVVPLWRLLRRPADDDRAAAAFVLGSVLAGTLIITLVTAAGRVYLCGADLAAVKACGATPRYVYPIVIALPAAVLAAALCVAARWRLVTALAVTAALAVGYLADRQGRLSLAKWDFSPLNRMLAERDGAARRCLVDYLAQTPVAAAPDWSRPLVCPGMWAAKNLAPYLRTAYETGAPFMPALLADAARAGAKPSVEALLAAGGLSAGGRSLWGTLAAAREDQARGHVDRFYLLKDGTPAISGWAVDLQSRGPAARIVVALKDRIIAVGAAGAERPDVAAVFGDPELRTDLKRAGFVVPLPGLTEDDAAALQAFAVTGDLRTAVLDGLPQRAAAAATPAATPALGVGGGGVAISPALDVTAYADGRPSALYRLNARDQGPILRHGGAAGDIDRYGARDAWAFRVGPEVYLHYDAAGPEGWLAALAVSRDGVNFEKKGAVLGLGAPGSADSASASYGLTYRDGDDWHMFYLGAVNASPPPGRIPALPYATLKARAASPAGPWIKQPDATPFSPRPGTYYAETASPGPVLKHGGEYLQFFSAAMRRDAGLITRRDAGSAMRRDAGAARDFNGVFRTLGLARAPGVDGPWTVDPAPILPPEEQIENAALYFQQETGTWFLFTNHVGLRDGVEFTDAVWVYWSQDLQRWNPENKAVVLDGRNSLWSKNVVGLPAVLPMGDRLAIYYDGLAAGRGEDPFSHLGRDVALAWLDLPIRLPAPGAGTGAGDSAAARAPATPRLLDVIDPPVPAPASVEPAPAARCFLERVNQSAPAPQPIMVGRLLSAAGWSALSAADGIAADEVLLSLRPAGDAADEKAGAALFAGGAPLLVKARRTPRDDVKAHIGHPGMSGDTGFVVTADVGGLSGTYRLDALQVRGGAAHPCGFDQLVRIVSPTGDNANPLKD